jgi:sortase A
VRGVTQPHPPRPPHGPEPTGSGIPPWAANPEARELHHAPPRPVPRVDEWREQRRQRLRDRKLGAWLIRGGPLLALLLVAWFGAGDDLTALFQQRQMRLLLAEQLSAPASTTPSGGFGFKVPEGSGTPVLPGAPTEPLPQVTLVALPGEDFSAPSGSRASGQTAAAVGRLRIPEIDLDWAIGGGVEREDLKAGPGWMPGSAALGGRGNAAVSAHRTTFGGPFRRLDELKRGSRIMVDVPGTGTVIYEVRDVFAVTPKEVGVVAPTEGSRLTLTTCSPIGSAKWRLVVQAEQISGPAASFAVPAESWAPYAGQRNDDPAVFR